MIDILKRMKIQSNLTGDCKPYGPEVTNLVKYYEGAKIANQKIHQLWDLLPLLKEEIVGDGNFGNDYVKTYLTHIPEMGY